MAGYFGKAPKVARAKPQGKRARSEMSVSRLHNLVAEAFNDLFAKHGKPEIAPAQAQHAE
jgi:hypothetical protein